MKQNIKRFDGLSAFDKIESHYMLLLIAQTQVGIAMLKG